MIITYYLKLPFRKIRNKYRQLKRCFRWFRRAWSCPDWDSAYLIEMIVDKLKDMRYQFDVIDIDFVDLRHQPVSSDKINNKMETTDYLKSLDEAIEVGERLLKSDYIKYTPEIDDWFKNNKIYTEDENGFLKSNMPKNISKELKRVHEESVKKEISDNKKFFNLIRDNHYKWWS